MIFAINGIKVARTKHFVIMTTIKSYTDLEQSKKLTEILSLESADMTWEQVDLITGDFAWEPLLGLDVTIKDNLFSYRNGYTIPCWSLAALLDVLPEGMVLLHDINGLGYKCIRDFDTNWHKNPVDACVEMILKLNELNLLKL